MRIRYFRYGVGKSWELNFIGSVFNLRIARHQLALWRNNRPVFDTYRLKGPSEQVTPTK